jgi:hypothetical protein
VWIPINKWLMSLPGDEMFKALMAVLWVCLLLGVGNACTPSASGTTVPPAASITDSACNVWTLTTGGGNVYKNGAYANGGGSQLLYYNANVYLYSNPWYRWNGTNGWIAIGGDPRLMATPTPTPVPTATPTRTVLSSTLNLTSADNGKTFSHYSITTTSGDCLNFHGVSNVTFQQSEIGPCGQDNSTAQSQGINIDPSSSNIHIYDNYIHTTYKASQCCDSHDGIFDAGANSIIQGNIVTFWESNIEGGNGQHGSLITGNFLLNPRGPFPRGMQIGTGVANNSSNVTVSHNRTLSCQQSASICAQSGAVACLACSASTLSSVPISIYAVQADAIAMFEVQTSTVDSNWVEGGDNAAGQGISVDEGSNNSTITNNVLKDTGQGCIGGTQGTGTVTGNKCESTVDIDVSQTGINFAKYGGSQSCGPWTVSNNVVSALGFTTGSPCNPAISACPFNSYFNDSTCPVTLSGNTLDQGSFAAHTAPGYIALNPIAVTNPPPLIPPLPKTCVIQSPYSSQTSLPGC